jgi:hypothetical protein
MRQTAFDLLEAIISRGKIYDDANKVINDAVSSTTAEFTHRLNFMDGEVHAQVCRLIDAAIGYPNADLASYFLLEKGCITCCDKQWHLRNLREFKAYIKHCDNCKARDGNDFRNANQAQAGADRANV